MTEGPWVAQHWHGATYGMYSGSVLKYTIHDAQGNKIADFVEQKVVNLISAAPDLLEALEAVLTLCRNASQSQGFSFNHFKECQLIELAISKAKGKQS